jgi:hypothetical protein
MKRWLAVGVLGLALVGCTSMRQAIYDNCMVDRGDEKYCDNYARVEVFKATSPRPTIPIQF